MVAGRSCAWEGRGEGADGEQVAGERVDKGWKGKERKGREDEVTEVGEGWTRKEKLRVDGKENWH